MKIKLLFALFIVLAFSFSANSQIKFIENFNYPSGDSIGAHGWIWNTGTTNTILVTSPGLTYTGYSGSGVGNAVLLKNTGNDAYKSIGDSIMSGSVYVSLMVKIDSAKTAGDYFFNLGTTTSTSIFQPRVYVKDSLGSLSFGLSKGPNALYPSYGSNGFLYGTTYLIVAKYTFNSGSNTDDELKLYVFTSPALPATEPATPYLGPYTSSTTDLANIGRVFLRQGSTASSPVLVLDGIKIATTWQSIVSGIINISSIAENFSLSQNYPNPFNPSTTIKFSIPSNGFVNLKVFNTLGQEVQSLVSGQLSAGVYNADFNGSKLTSGVYYYRLDYTGNDGKQFSDVKKLMLIK